MFVSCKTLFILLSNNTNTIILLPNINNKKYWLVWLSLMLATLTWSEKRHLSYKILGCIHTVLHANYTWLHICVKWCIAIIILVCIFVLRLGHRMSTSSIKLCDLLVCHGPCYIIYDEFILFSISLYYTCSWLVFGKSTFVASCQLPSCHIRKLYHEFMVTHLPYSLPSHAFLSHTHTHTRTTLSHTCAQSCYLLIHSLFLLP